MSEREEYADGGCQHSQTVTVPFGSDRPFKRKECIRCGEIL